MRNIVAFPLIGLAVILQSSVISELKLLSGYADLILLLVAAWALQARVESAWHWVVLACILVGFVSSMPWPILVVGYLAVVFMARTLRRLVWQAPLLAMFSAVFLGTLFMHLLSFAVLRLLGTPFLFNDVMGWITLPALLLNMLFSIPVYAFMRNLAHWVYPFEEYE